MPMFTRSSAVKRSSTPLMRAMKWGSISRPVQGLRESLRQESRPSVKSIETLTAPAAKAARTSFSHSSIRSASNASRE